MLTSTRSPSWAKAKRKITPSQDDENHISRSKCKADAFRIPFSFRSRSDHLAYSLIQKNGDAETLRDLLVLRGSPNQSQAEENL